MEGAAIPRLMRRAHARAACRGTRQVVEAALAEEHSKPYGGGAGFGPLDPVLATRGQQQTIARPESHDLPVRISQLRSTLQKQHPLVLVLLVPGPFRAALTG